MYFEMFTILFIVCNVAGSKCIFLSFVCIAHITHIIVIIDKVYLETMVPFAICSN